SRSWQLGRRLGDFAFDVLLLDDQAPIYAGPVAGVFTVRRVLGFARKESRLADHVLRGLIGSLLGPVTVHPHRTYKLTSSRSKGEPECRAATRRASDE